MDDLVATSLTPPDDGFRLHLDGSDDGLVTIDVRNVTWAIKALGGALVAIADELKANGVVEDAPKTAYALADAVRESVRAYLKLRKQSERQHV